MEWILLKILIKRKSQIKPLGEHLLQMNSQTAVLGEDGTVYVNVKLDIRKASENGGSLIGEAKGLLIYMTELSISLHTFKDEKVNVHKVTAEARILNAKIT